MTTSPPTPLRHLRRFAGTAVLLVFFPFLGGAGFFALHAATWHGVGFWICVAAIPASVVGFIATGRRPRPPHLSRPFWLGTLLTAVVFLVVSFRRAPVGSGGDATLRVEHVFTATGDRFPRFSGPNAIAEWDQVAAGIALARWLDPYIDAAQADHLRDLLFPLYSAMRDDLAFADMGSVLTWAYSDVFGASFPSDHYVALIPRPSDATRRTPGIVFLHGSAGNFSCYWYALAPLAREMGHAVVAPSFGFGNWHREGGSATIHRVTEHAQSRYGLGDRPLYLVALSNAGRGALRAVAQRPRLFRGVVLISAVLDDESIAQATDRRAWDHVSVLLIHGTDDRRIPARHAEQNLAVLRRSGARVTGEIVSGEDHFLLLSRRSWVLERIADWTRTDP